MRPGMPGQPGELGLVAVAHRQEPQGIRRAATVSAAQPDTALGAVPRAVGEPRLGFLPDVHVDVLLAAKARTELVGYCPTRSLEPLTDLGVNPRTVFFMSTGLNGKGGAGSKNRSIGRSGFKWAEYATAGVPRCIVKPVSDIFRPVEVAP